ncbi:cell division topological specificity factor MinE [Acetatifactor muris]|jgi:cell division topological specificity factor|uniref:Cell division topological specificity factor n=1 Tax=Acetatifactor muris TaxID=879566 RepID=A0A2K4ZJK9_9FIRM|nr:cell division topological specificity factor MinE [Acetatifactor muris]MCI8798250.1 cell division topological specificity factor MinE [Lachnospiraceae bacterium]MCR2048936.1 cell division topological specificity factor MinE [Acetatifactor muris]SOY30645.1 cell division topological specificity factor MinE [Acetatifactor muris]
MRHFFRRKSSCQIAKDRLKILLISDRVNCSPEVMELIKTDIAKVLSKYMKIDSDNMDIQINTKGSKSGRGGKMPVLYANIPIMDVPAQQTEKNSE